MRFFLFSFLLISHLLYAQKLIPSEGERLNFTQVLFETRSIQNAEKYLFIIESTDESGQPVNAITQEDPTHVTIVNDLSFGTRYRWRVIAKDKNNESIFESDLHHFEIGKALVTDSTEYRFLINKYDTSKVANGVIFLDYSNVAINRFGKPIWYLPNIGKGLRTERMRDLKMTPTGSLTILSNKLGLDFDLRGNAIWSTPGDGKISGDSLEFYHHEFTKLHSGNYLVLCNGFENKSLDLGDQHIDRIPLSYIVEYDSFGDTVWTWNSGMYVTYDDYLKVGTKVFRGNSFGHMNSADINESKGLIYAGFRDLNAILVIDKKSRKVIRTYGDKIPSDTTDMAIGFFKKQHAAVSTSNGEIVLFNNNLDGETSSVVLFNEPNSDKPDCQLLWEFKCDFDELMPSHAGRLGNVQEMSNDQFLVNMGDVARLFEVNRKNEILWDCLPQKWNSDSLVWKPFTNYRLHFRKSLYPCYFSHVLKNDEHKGVVLQVANEGSEKDSYLITITTAKNRSYSINMNVDAETIQLIQLIEVFKKRHVTKMKSVSVQSLNNPLLKQESFYSIK